MAVEGLTRSKSVCLSCLPVKSWYSGCQSTFSADELGGDHQRIHMFILVAVCIFRSLCFLFNSEEEEEEEEEERKSQTDPKG